MNRATPLLVVLLAVASGPALAQPAQFPQRPIRIVVLVPPGGSVDATAPRSPRSWRVNAR